MDSISLDNRRILVVDDSSVQRFKLKTYLEGKGCIVQLAENGNAMKQAFILNNYDIILLDVNMPGDDGFTLVPYLREHHNAGIIMVTASKDVVDKVLALELGADDYITKPFEPRELIARIKSVLRRMQTDSKETPNNDHLIRFGRCVLDLNTQQLLDASGCNISLTSMEFDLLKAFSEHPGRVLTRDYLLNVAHNRDSSPFDRSIDIRITRIRRKLELNPGKPSIIKTVRGAGYMFNSKP